ncbi:hypothetical protein O181_048194 [Austropuccinia psidii MF-1]|uniref:Uncharacterized protein n=1 Tax=Austropuccinia psidii MF-1 TaxID=1389203 RepID=A0A9Q3HMR4_9BASI|nr:hypothetical protein [Austropuccinia psidii MF-1]
MPTLTLELASASPPNPLQCLVCLCAHNPPDETPTLPPISTLTTPYAYAPLPHLLLSLQFLRSCGALNAHLTCLRCYLQSLRLQFPPDMPLMRLAIHMLAVPSQHASDAPLTLAQSSRPLIIFTLLQLPISTLTTPYASAPRLISSAAYKSYAPGAPS